MLLFDIKNQLGLSREIRLKAGEKRLSSPSFIFPLQTFVWKNLAPSTLAFLNQYDYFVGLIPDELGLDPYGSNVELLKEDSFKHKLTLLGGINEWGITPALLDKNKDNSDQIFLLRESFPHQNIDRFEEFDLAATQDRLQFYSQLFQSITPENQFIIEFRFINSHKKLHLILNWMKKNIRFLSGLKLNDIFANLGDFNEILYWLKKLKEELPTDLLFIVGGAIFPENFALATYCGFDVFDLTGMVKESLNGLYMTNYSRQWLSELNYPLCTCTHCMKLAAQLPGSGKESPATKFEILQHNLFVAFSEISRLRQVIRDGTLHTYVERQIHSSPMAAALLRQLDHKFPELIYPRYPLIASHKVSCIGTEAYYRPEIQNFIQTIKNNASPAKYYPIVLILPCAAKKPYSKSKSHQRFLKSLRKSLGKQNYNLVHQVILTSPLGIIPREMEEIFPAAHYDIPVTGDWDAEEIQMASDCLIDWLKKYPASPTNPSTSQLIVVGHVAGGYRNALKHAESYYRDHSEEFPLSLSFQYTLPTDRDISASSNEGLDALEAWFSQFDFASFQQPKLERKSLDKYLRLSQKDLVIRATFDYQFGKGVGDYVLSQGCVLHQSRNPNYDEVVKHDGAGKMLVGRLFHDSGLIALSPGGGEMLIGVSLNQVKINMDDMQGTTVFRPILSSIDETLHPNDEVLVLSQDDVFLGVGILAQTSLDVIKSINGTVCKLRKKVKRKVTALADDLALLGDLDPEDE